MLAAKLDKIDRALASLASTDPAFAQLAIGIRPDAKLSSQSLDILRKFEAAKASRVYEFRSQDTLLLFFSDGKGGQLEYDDPRFIEDDLHSLVELGLLRPDQNSSGKRVYVFTRSAAELVKQS